MPLDKLIEQMPAFGALCFLVFLAGRYLLKITNNYMAAMQAYMSEIRELSATCHSSHREVSETTASAVRDCTAAITGLHQAQHETSLVMAEVRTLLKSANGRGGAKA